jgi:hypothetical protein
VGEMDSKPIHEKGDQAIPYHALLCEILSSLLGVRCCARVLVSALLDESLSKSALDVIFDFLEGDAGDTDSG